MTRPRLQLHLSTLLAVMLFAAGLVWLNARHQYSYFVSETTREEADLFPDWQLSPAGAIREKQWTACGWPSLFIHFLDDPRSREPKVIWQGLVLDITVCVLLLALAGAGIEWATRRMKRKPAP